MTSLPSLSISERELRSTLIYICCIDFDTVAYFKLENVSIICFLLKNVHFTTKFVKSLTRFREKSVAKIWRAVSSNKRLQQTQAQVDEVVDIMKVNVDKVLERDAKLSELDSRADQLQAGASQFEHRAARLKRKMWWQNCKVQYLRVKFFSHVELFLASFSPLCG
ncbi:Vesicle-associated membrane protein 3 [Stylophora pistillata]|uniref:Vesicle-associated membrane protein 3 n=1 Tax=Stylophora pistillata TaxID=50429 RepID=A0A2B4SE54_STYPI|nr:Vesicle-associated membrane protein 3 [Stylophora pistillata]